MKKLLSILLMLGLLILPTQLQAKEFVDSNLFHHLNQAGSHAVSIISFGKEGGYCSGTVLKNTATKAYILTAKHCITLVDEMYVNGVSVSSIQTSVSQDLALLKTNEPIPNKTSSKLAISNANRGEELFGIGYPGASKPYVIRGNVFIKGLNDHYGVLNIVPGTSGAGLYDNEGQLVGIVWGNMGRFGAYESVSQIRKFLKEAGYEEK